ncbi:urease accessory protein UreD [Cyanobacterium aponinum FACHB-4101]|uniref:urease accessory protein UreD n=1 Tax=Cyanobacterium aponinum TaxID=379064 RepID=UPI001680ADE6|nr:urease accessory protein UreD [Cyanobacterium aponinum]MBD2395513.1 urease accessory protein UreD [Cyanobacterium aponinum FACHB-4101]
MKNWQGIINLVYEHQKQETTIKSVFSQAPFKFQNSFYPEGKSVCHSVILHTAGGIAGDDILSQNICLANSSQVLITTPAATKIYGSKGKKAIQEVKIKLEKNAYLEYLPQEMIVFNNANFEQKVRVDLEDNASWLGWEIIRFGRSARGEIFSEGNWLNYLEIWRENKPIWIDRQYFMGNSPLFYASNGLGGNPVVGNLVYIGSEDIDQYISNLRHLIKEKYDENIGIGITALQQGLLCRYMGDSVSAAKEYFTLVWQFLRDKRGLDGNFKSRIWQ